MNDEEPRTADYVAEELRSAFAHEAHELGITVSVEGNRAVLEGVVETDNQRARIEEIARRVAPQLEIVNRTAVVDLAGAVKKESLT